ncbi:MAG: LytTR family DNA-binding domain-containing protein [Bacteroidota bacterium]
MKCIIIEDQPPAQRILKKYIADYGSLELVGVFSDALRAMSYLKQHTVDLMFLDIHLPKLSGMDFLRSLQSPPSVILTTAYPDFALESYDLSVVDYLLKPFSFSRFVTAVGKVPDPNASTSTSPSQNGSIFIKSGYEHIRVNLNDILYIKADNDYTEIHLDHKKHLSSESLKHWLESIGSEKLIQVHKSYLVNLGKIKKVSSTSIGVENDHIIPIGRAFKDEVIKRLIPGF